MGYMQDISENMIIVRNLNRSSDGDIFIFDRKGNGLRKINRQGSGAEEYRFLLRVTLDEENKELFVVDHWSKKYMCMICLVLLSGVLNLRMGLLMIEYLI